MQARTLMLAALLFVFPHVILAQSLGNAGTIQGSVVDPSGAAVAGADVTIHNPISGYTQTVKSASDGTFKFQNIPPNPYHMDVKASGFDPFSQEVAIRSSLPIEVKVSLAVAGISTTVS